MQNGTHAAARGAADLGRLANAREWLGGHRVTLQSCSAVSTSVYRSSVGFSRPCERGAASRPKVFCRPTAAAHERPVSGIVVVNMTTPRRSSAGVSLRGRLAIASAFAAFMAAGLAFGYWVSGRPTVGSECSTRCSTTGKVGTMVYSGPDTPKSSYKAAHSECTCR